MSKLARLIAGAPDHLASLIGQEEGYGLPGTVPTRDNNPGDLRHSPHSQHPGDPNGIGVIDTPAHGWEDLERQLEKYAARQMTLRAAIYAFAPPAENNSEGYLNFVCAGLGCSPDTPVSEALKIP
ncbi:MAG TPA: hypothetical protein VFX20_18060 [Steroidobacteraceae bacterium]|nr:hypothetical protein [Steroidobacteraceae bacterium]